MDSKEYLRDRISNIINTHLPVVSRAILSASDLCNIDCYELTKVMEELITEYQGYGMNITYACSADGCQVTICNLLTNSPGGRCAIDYSMRRFKRGSPSFKSYIKI
jgi:hypothetical protein